MPVRFPDHDEELAVTIVRTHAAIFSAIKNPPANFSAGAFPVTGIQLAVEGGRKAFTGPDVIGAETGNPDL